MIRTLPDRCNLVRYGGEGAHWLMQRNCERYATGCLVVAK